MAKARPDLRRGRLVWANVRDPRGNLKQRPLIILTPTDAISADEPLLALAVTTTFPDPPPDDCVALPWLPQGRATTKLRKRSSAVLSWIVTLDASDIITMYGDVPARVMDEILRRLDG